MHCRRAPFDVYVGRPSLFGNPFASKPSAYASETVASRAVAIEKYAEWVLTQPEIMSRLPYLKGKTLGCWCSPLPCHGDVLARLADALPDDDHPF